MTKRFTAYSDDSSVAALPALIEEKLIFDRERSNGAYRVISFVVANTLVSLPFVFMIAVLFTAVAYPLVQLQGGAEKVANFILMLFLAIYTMESLIMIIAAVLPIFVVSLAIAAYVFLNSDLNWSPNLHTV